MAKEKFIIGKHDNGHHDGRAANLRREQAADFEMETEGMIFDGKMKLNQLRHCQNLSLLDGFFYHGIFYQDGVPQKSKR